MVEAIASPNKPPKLNNEIRPGSRKRHRFPTDYDWKKQKKVYKALVKVYKDCSAEIWEELVHKIGDRRYSLTVTDKTNEDSYNLTVGDVCRELAYDRLVGVFVRHRPRDERGNEMHPRIRLDIGIKDLAAWRKERKDKAFWELQIEVCERALQQLEMTPGATPANKKRARKKIQAEIKKLKRTKQPIVYKSDPWLGIWAPYTDGKVR
jgi:hypothetical protein